MLQTWSAEEPWERGFLMFGPTVPCGQAVELSVAVFWSQVGTILTTHQLLIYTGNLQREHPENP